MNTKKRAFPIKALLALLMIALSLSLTFCFSDDEEEEAAPTTQGGTTVGSLSVNAANDSIAADGSSQTSIMATVRDTDGSNIADGTLVTFSTTAGTLSAASSTTTNGLALVILTSATTTGTASIQATAGGVSGTTSVTFTSVPGYLSLSTDKTSVKSDNSDYATITASVLDANYVPITDRTVAFSTTGGAISASNMDTDADGEAEITFSSGTLDRRNQTVAITASVPGTELPSKQIPIQVAGTTVSLVTDTTNLAIGGSAATLEITVKDASGTGIYDAAVTVTVDASSTGTATLELAPGYTDYITHANGTLEVTVTGTGAGNVTVAAESLAATASQAYTVGATGDVFGISAPTDDPYSLYTGEDLIITVNAPSPIGSVQFATTLGDWDGTGEMVRTKAVAGGTASATLRSANAGVANVQVTDPLNTATTDTLKVAVSAPSSEASQISLQASATVVAVSTGDVKNSVTLTATVKNATGEPVGSSSVAFSIQDPTGGGETVSPVVVITDSYGEATSKFSSGSTSSDAQGVRVYATVVNTVINDYIDIVIGGTAASVAIGQGTTITSINSDTAYQLPMSVLVSDSNGNAMPGTIVSLSVWPARYATGCWVQDPLSKEWAPDDCDSFCNTYTFYPNEDANRNLILDFGEDIGPPGADITVACPTIPYPNPDGQLTPANSAAGAVPSGVTTDDNGVANFNLVYLKASAVWIRVEIKASTLVFGTETTGTYTFSLPWLAGEEESLPHSPYNFVW